MLVADNLGNDLCQHGFVTIETDASCCLLEGTRPNWSNWTTESGGSEGPVWAVLLTRNPQIDLVNALASTRRDEAWAMATTIHNKLCTEASIVGLTPYRTINPYTTYSVHVIVMI